MLVVQAKVIEYGGRGSTSLEDHAKTKKHVEKLHNRLTNSALPGAIPVSNSDKLYGLAPNLKCNVKDVEHASPIPSPAVHISDRKSNQEVMVLGVLAEHSLPFAMAPLMVDLAKELSRDKHALNRLGLTRTVASYMYKMQLGVAKTFEERLLSTLRSLNMDKSMSKNHKKC